MWLVIQKSIVRKHTYKYLDNTTNLTDITHNGKVYTDIWKGMYGIPQSGRIAHDRLKNHLEKHGYQTVKFTPRLWNHKSRPTSFTLIVDDFGINYVGKQDAEHLIKALKESYKTTVDWEGKFYSALTIKWNYKDKYVGI